MPAAWADTGTITYNTEFVSKFGSLGIGDGQFNTAEAIAKGADGNLYVADRWNHRIQVFDQSGNYLAQFGSFGGGPGQLNEPTWVSFDPDGNIVVSSIHTGAVNIYDKDTYAFIRSITGLSGPHGTINVGSNMYIIELYNHQIRVVDTSGNTVGNLGTADMLFPHFITQTSDGKFYVTEYLAGHVRVYDSNFNFLNTETIGAGILDRPVGIYKDGHDNLFVVDSENDRIVVFDQAGNILATYGSEGSGDGQFFAPRGIYVDENGKFYVTEGYSFVTASALNHRVQEFLFTSTETFNTSPGAGDQNATTDYAIAQLTGTGSFDDAFIGYDDLLVNGDWNLGGTSSFDNSITLNAGDLTIDTGGDLTASILTMNAGRTLIVDGSLTTTDPLNVTNGGFLKGSGTIHADTVVKTGATIAPGSNAIGTLTVDGDYTHEANSIYEVEVNDAGQSDRIVVSGNVTLTGVLDIQAAAGTYGFVNNYTILSSTGTISGTYSSILNNLAFLTPSLVYNANNVQLNLTQNGSDFEDYAVTPNQRHTAAALDHLLTLGGSDITTIGTALSTLTTEQANQAINEIAPDEIASMMTIRGRFATHLNNLVERRLNALSVQGDPRLSGVGFMAMDDLGSIATAAGFNNGTGDPVLRNRNIWFQATGAITNQKKDFNAVGSRATTGIFRGGIDKQIGQSPWIVGVSPGYVRSEVEFKGEQDTAEVNYYRLDGYGAYQKDNWDISLIGGFGLGRQNSKRYINAGGLDRVAEGGTWYNDLSAQASAGYFVPLQNQAYIRPALSVTTGYTWQDDFTEKGAGALNLRYSGNSDAYVQFHPNVTVGKNIVMNDKQTVFNPYVGFGAIYRPGRDRETQIAAFDTAAPGGPAFGVEAPRNDQITFEINAGFNVYNPEKENQPTVQMHYRGLASDTVVDHAFTASFTWNF